MRLLKKTIFWLHLVVGLAVGLIIFILAVTGVAMSFERQILESTVPAVLKSESPIKGPEMILAAQAGMRPPPTALIYTNDPRAPVAVQFGRGKTVFVDPYTGGSLGEGNVKTKKFFSWVLTLHRWLAQEGKTKEVGKGITGAATLGFMFLVASGLWLWFPKRWTRSGLKAILTIRGNLKGRARDWNWHNVFGFWACVPLFAAALTGTIMAYGWANKLVYQMVGETPPPPRKAESPPAEGGEAAAAGAENRASRGGPGGERRGEGRASRGPVDLTGLDNSLAAVKARDPKWRTIQIPMPRGATAQFTVSESHRGRPDLRKQVTMDLATATVVKSEGMETQSTGRQLRTWVRWIHTGEAFGWIGQAVAAIAALSAIVLVYTGFALSWRRFFRRRRINAVQEASGEAA